MPDNREHLENLLGDLKAERDQAEALAAGAADRLARMASGLSALNELDPDEIRAAADTFAGSIERLRVLNRCHAGLKRILIG